MTTPDEAAGGDAPGNCMQIEVRVAEMTRLFNSLDPTPFRERDLDPDAVDFIVGWARELHADAPLCLLIHVDREGPAQAEIPAPGEAIRKFFRQRADAARQRLRQLMRNGRTSLMIGLAFLAGSIATGDIIAGLMGQSRFAGVFRESLLIGGWVAMWRPLEVFLYDWWPIRAEAGLYDRLGRMAVRIVPSRTGS